MTLLQILNLKNYLQKFHCFRSVIRKLVLFFLSLFFCCEVNFSAAKAQGLSMIRDAQSEKFLQQLAAPIFASAKLDANNIKIYIVDDDEINAFVSGGQNIFINSGLIRKYKTPDALIGVIAHEVGHISAGHLARSGEGLEQANGAMILSYLLGAGAIAAGAPDAGVALIAGGSNSAQRIYAKYTRNQEEAADNHAIKYLEDINYPADGLLKLLEFFERQMIGYQGQIDEYLLSHPISKKRIEAIKFLTKDKKFSNKKINQILQPQMNLVLAKLEAFMDDAEIVLEKNRNQNDELSNYKKSIALFRKGKMAESLDLIDRIISKKNKGSQDLGFLLELKGQILFESGEVAEAAIFYDKAIKILDAKDSSQAKISFASAILSLVKNDKTLLKLALTRLEEAMIFEEENSFLFKQLANAYDKMSDEPRSLLALARYNLLIGDKEKCQKYAKLAKEKLPKNSKSELLQAEDLIQDSKLK